MLRPVAVGNKSLASYEEWDIFARYHELNAAEITGGWDVIIVHDPQPAGIRAHDPAKSARWVWRCHREHVRVHFLTPRLLRDWLRIFRER